MQVLPPGKAFPSRLRFLRPLLKSPLLFVFLFALALRAGYLAEIHGTLIWDWHTWAQSDMDTFLKVARQILSGDLLVREPYRPYHYWHMEVAPADTWNRWYSPHAFYQSPGYYYFASSRTRMGDFGSF